MQLQLRIQRNEEFAEVEVFRFGGSIIRVCWEGDGRLVSGRVKRPLLVFYQQENGCRVRCVPPEAIKLNGVPLDREQRLAVGDQIERADGLVAVVGSLTLQEEQGEQGMLLTSGRTAPGRLLRTFTFFAAACLSCGVVLGGILGAGWKLPDARLLLARGAGSNPVVQAAAPQGTVAEVARNLKETLWQVSESRAVSAEEMLVELANARSTAQQLARLRSDEPLAVVVASAVNSFYQLSSGLVAEDREALQLAIESARRCLKVTGIDRRDELVQFYRSLATISLREAQSRLKNQDSQTQ